MGFCVSIYAIFDCEPSQMHRQLALSPTGEKEDFPDAPIVAATARSGAYILFINDRENLGEDVIKPLLACEKVLACTVNETVMFSSVALHENGKEVWSVFHDANQGLLHLETSGDVPEIYEKIRAEKIQMQNQPGDNPDYVFDVPVDLFVQMGGIKYCEDIDSDEEEPWETLVPIQ